MAYIEILKDAELDRLEKRAQKLAHSGYKPAGSVTLSNDRNQVYVLVMFKD